MSQSLLTRLVRNQLQQHQRHRNVLQLLERRTLSTPVSHSRPKLRRTRIIPGHYKAAGNHKPFVDPILRGGGGGGDASSSSTVPFDHGLDSTEEYLNKTTLSPWVPLPEVVARKALDVAGVTSEDVHVDLGSGDGRVCFLALDAFGAARSVGVDVDEAIVSVAEARKSKRHPSPTNLQFYVGDLLDPFSSAWDVVLTANPTVITMYFASSALTQLRPVLEEKLVGRSCRIVTSGYEMPGWEASTFEVVLGTQIYLYQWNTNATGSEPSAEEDHFFGFTDSLLSNRPGVTSPSRTKAGRLQEHLEGGGSFQGSKVVDRTGQYAIRGYNPNIFDEVEEDSDDEEHDGNDTDMEDDEHTDVDSGGKRSQDEK
jgi:Methyltransferase domain